MKRMLRITLTHALTAAALTFAAAVAAEDADDDEIQLSYEEKLDACAACHGPNGAEPLAPTYPKIAGQHASYLEHALKSYRSGRRNNAIMMSQAQLLELTDADIKKLAKHFSKQSGLEQVPID
jgi:cytochrome c553